MPLKTVSPGIYAEKSGHRAVAKASGRRSEKRFPYDIDLVQVRRWRDMERARLLAQLPSPSLPAPDTLAADIQRFIRRTAHLKSWTHLKCNIRMWLEPFGHRHRDRISDAQIRRVVDAWRAAGVAEKTTVNRVQALQRLYHLFDGKDVPTPADLLMLEWWAKQRVKGRQR